MSLSIRIVEYKKGAIRLEPKKLAKFEKAQTSPMHPSSSSRL